MKDDAGRDTMEVADKSRIRGTEIVLTVVPNPPQKKRVQEEAS